MHTLTHMHTYTLMLVCVCVCACVCACVRAQWIRRVELQQADFMWVLQLAKDRDVTAQLEAVHGLARPFR